MTNTPTEREKILARINALKAKTTANGCTEAEAIEAAKKVVELLQKYGIEEAELEDIKTDTYGAAAREESTGKVYRTWHPTHILWTRIANICGVRILLYETKLLFFGEKNDVLTAFYMVDLFKNTADTEFKRYRRTQVGRDAKKQHHGMTVKASWMGGFVYRMSQRLDSLLEEKKMAEAKMMQKSSELIVLKDQIIESRYSNWLQKAGLKIKAGAKKETTVKDYTSFYKGVESGSKVHIGEVGQKLSGGQRRLNK